MRWSREVVGVLAVLALGACSEAEGSWRFLTLADWHRSEKYTQSEKNPDWLTEAIAEDVATVRLLKENYGGELILLPGDSGRGRWHRRRFLQQNFPGSMPEEAILKAGHLCYSGMIEAFKKGGYGTLLMAVGDHELGDNPWPARSAAARCQPQYREAFAREFNMEADGLSFRYPQPIGEAPSRPLGTQHESTSYAYQHKNVLFVTVDVFDQKSPTRVIGDQGTVTGAVTGKQLEWLEFVLSEARIEPSIRYVFVQGHLPVLYPVRKVGSSGMMMDDGEESPFWKTLRKHQVDIYFAGEVHANTATKDPVSDLVQVVTRGNWFDNFVTVDVSEQRIELVVHAQGAAKREYEPVGRLVIDKSGERTQFEGEGELALLDPDGVQLHFGFESDFELAERKIVGLRNRSRTLRGVTCDRAFPNRGQFGLHYSALTANVERVDGVRGKAGLFGENSRMAVSALGPHYRGHAVSYALWVRTTSAENQLLVNSAAIWEGRLQGFMNLDLDDGIPEVMISPGQRLVGESTRLNDGSWHHLAAVMPSDGCLLSEVELYVDGKPVSTSLVGKDRRLRFNQAVRLGFGGLNYSHRRFDALPVKPFAGALDEISVWTRSLGADEVAAMVE